MTTTNQPIAEEFPPAWLDSPIPYKLLASAYNELRERAILLESIVARVAELEYEEEDGMGKLPPLVKESQAALN